MGNYLHSKSSELSQNLNKKSFLLPIPVFSPSKDRSLSLPSDIKSDISIPRCLSFEKLSFEKVSFEPANLAQITDVEIEDLSNQLNDCWNLYNNKVFKCNKDINNSIHRISSVSDRKYNHLNWKSVFGTHIIRNGEYKIWKLKIYPRFGVINYDDFGIANIVIGICDSKTIHDGNNKYNNFKGRFHMKPYFGYGYYGYNGKKLHKFKWGLRYAQKYKIYDVITVDLDMQSNELNFYVNDEKMGIAYHIDDCRSYVLAVSFCDNNYDVQICQYQFEY